MNGSLYSYNYLVYYETGCFVSMSRKRGGFFKFINGWKDINADELFMQYKRALVESECKYFLYENNNSMSNAIREGITRELGVQPIMINSALVSGQNRERLYWTNIPNVEQPEDKGIVF